MASSVQRLLPLSLLRPMEASGLPGGSAHPGGRHFLRPLASAAADWTGGGGGGRPGAGLLPPRPTVFWAECELWPGRGALLQQQPLPELVRDKLLLLLFFSFFFPSFSPPPHFSCFSSSFISKKSFCSPKKKVLLFPLLLFFYFL